jgi:glyoxylase-like metal-dependent hydrolase (beta-lactamase superfamily II)
MRCTLVVRAARHLRAPLLLVALAVAADVGAQAQLAIEPVADGLYVIVGSRANVGVRVTSEGVILIDSALPQDFVEVRRLVGTVTDLPIRYVINTHHHRDHTGGNAQFAGFAEIVAHENARDQMVRDDLEGLPTVVFTDETTVRLGDVEVRVYAVDPAHTNGDAIVYFPDLGTVYAGDLLHEVSPYIVYEYGGTSRGWLAALDGMLELQFDSAIPGHGSVMSRSDVIAYRDQMEGVRAKMAELIRGGGLRRHVATRFVTPELPWTTYRSGLFMSRSVAGLYEEIARDVRSQRGR